MPASLPGSTLAQNKANPSLGVAVLFDLLSGPKGSPKDNETATANQCSTGALSTGIGYGSPPIIDPTAPASIRRVGFTDDYTPGESLPDASISANSSIMYIGGGKCNAAANGVAAPAPYTAGFGFGMAGNGGNRDAGAGPAFTGFLTKTVTATGAVANGAVIETGWVNRSGVSLATGQSVFGSAVAASATPA